MRESAWLRKTWSYKIKSILDITGTEVSSFAAHVEEAIFRGCVQHRLPHSGVVRIRDVQDRELNERPHGYVFARHDGFLVVPRVCLTDTDSAILTEEREGTGGSYRNI